MRVYLLRLIIFTAVFATAQTVLSQPGSGWNWSATSGKATPSTGRQIRDIITDVAGNVYAIGDFEGSMTLGTTTLNTTGDGSVGFNYDADAFVVKYDASGNLLWAKQYGRAGTSNNDRGEVISVDAAGNVYAGGNAGVPFLNKYDNNGNLLWSKSYTLYDLGGINIGPDGNPIIMESNQTAKKIYKLDQASGNTLWTVSNTGVGSNSTSTFQDFVDQSGNVYFTAFGSGAVTVAGNNFTPASTSTYIASLDNNGVTRWVNELPGVQVQLSYTIDKAGKSYVVIGGGSGTYQGIPIGGCAACGNHYLEFNAAGVLTFYTGISPFKALMRVTDNAIYSYGVNGGSPYGGYTEVYGDNIIRSRAGMGQDIGVVAKYDVATRQPIWAETFELNGNNSLNTIEPAVNGKFLVGGSYATSVKFGTNTSTATIVGQAAYNPLDFFIAQFNPSNLLPSPTTSWTGAANNGSWADAGNWTSGAPNGNEKSIIPAGVSNYPVNISTNNYTGKLTVQSGVTITLPIGFDAPVGIVNDGIIEVKGSGTFQGFNTSQLAPLTGSGRLLFTANSPSSILYDLTTNGLEINYPSGTILSYGGVVGGSLLLTAGKLNASNPVFLTSPAATLTYSATAYITGTLKRATNTSGNYVFPMGNANVYAPVTMTLNSVTGTQNISVEFPESFAQTAGTTPNINLGAGRTITSKLNNNQWIITPDVPMTSGTYALTLQAGGYTNGVTDLTRYVVIKRKDNTSPWGFDGTNGTSTQTGGTVNGSVVSNGVVTVTASGLGAFSTFGVGISAASVASGIATATSNWTGNAGNGTWNDAGNWDNGIPNGLINAKIPAGKATYPATFVATDNARSVQNDAGAAIKLPYNFTTNGDIISNGSIEVTGTNSATFKGFGTSTNGYAPLSGTGKLILSNNSPGIFSGTFDNTIEVNRTNSLYAQSVYIGGSLNVVSGNLFTSYLGNETFITMLNPTAGVTATATYPVQGTLTRTVNTSGTYNYPIGEGPSRYAPVTVTTSNLAGTTRISGQYYSTIYSSRTFSPADGQPVSALNAGQWTITPDNAATGGTFNITMEARGYNNGVADATRYVLLKSNSSNGWDKVDNAVITENAGVITATATNQPALTVQTVYIIGVKGASTTWTGAANNQSWTTAGNWTNGVPDFTYKAIFVNGSANYPASVTTSNTAGMVDIAAGVSLKLPQGFNIPQGILNNGTIEVIGTTAFAGLANGNTPLSGAGKLLFTAASPASFSSSFTTLNQGLELNRAGNFAVTNLTINGSLTLTNGIIVGNVTLSDAASTIAYNATSYIQGSLKRTVNPTGVYLFPVGAADRFVPATLTLNNLTGPQNITVSFSSVINGNPPNTTAQSIPVTQLLNVGIWTVLPNTQTTGGSYTLTLEGRAYTNGVADPARYVVLRRDASNYDWGFYGSNGAATQSNNVVTATGNMTGFLREYAIGIANSAVAVALPLNLVSFTAAKKDAAVAIAFATENEVNISSMIVQHSSDATSWKNIYSVAATNGSAHQYSYLHTSPIGGANYYRLLVQDRNGRITFSSIRRVQMSGKSITRVYPNPVTGNSFTIDLSGNTGATYYRLLNIDGRTITAGTINAMQQTITLDGVSSGNYHLQLSTGEIIKLIKK